MPDRQDKKARLRLQNIILCIKCFLSTTLQASFIVLCLLPSLFSNTIRIMYTSALIPDSFAYRKGEYIRSLKNLKIFGYIPNTYVIESGPWIPESFFSKYASNVFYAGTNKILYNKGVNESMAMIQGLEHYHFDDDDMIVKLTGRYLLFRDTFLKKIEDNPEIDAFVTGKVNDVFTGCYALRCKHMLEMYKQLDLLWMEENYIAIEWEVAKYINKLESENKIKVMRLPHIDIIAHPFYTDPG